MANLSVKRSYEDDNGGTSNAKERKELGINRYLTYDVIRIIFKYLNGRELSNASMVCRSWLEMANDEKRTRIGPVCFTENLKRGIQDFNIKIIEKLRIIPTFGFIFKAPCRGYNRNVCKCKILPRNCDAVVLATFGILINNNEMENALDNVVCAFLPKIPNVMIKVIEVSAPIGDKAQYYIRIKTNLDSHNANGSKCLLILTNQQGRTTGQAVADVIKLCDKTVKPSVWGGVVKDLSIYELNNTNNYKGCRFTSCVVIIIAGLVDSWSIVVDESCDTKELVEQKLILFKNHIRLRKHSIGYMFACCERGKYMFNEYNVESSIFKKLFPTVPLVGCFGDGEFGATTVPNKNFNDNSDTVYYERSSVFLIVTYG